MRSIVISLFITMGWLTQGVCQSTDWEALLNDVTTIVTVRVGAEVASHHELTVVNHWKGKFTYNFVLKSIEVPFKIQKGEHFLLFIDGNGPELQLAAVPVASNQIPGELQTLLDKLPCFLETETAAYKKKADPNFTGACHRIYDPVCGCDGITYDNACAAQLQGIVKYSTGKCKADPR